MKEIEEKTFELIKELKNDKSLNPEQWAKLEAEWDERRRLESQDEQEFAYYFDCEFEEVR